MAGTPDTATFPRAARSPDATARVTASAGMVLFVLLAVQGVTILRIHRLITAHFFVGFLLLGPVVLKLASTGYRFMRYYTGDPAYREAGPPRPLLRIAAPFLVLTTAAVFASGVALAFVKPGHTHGLTQVHKASFVLWFGVTTIHVLAYLPRAARLTFADLTGRGPAGVATGRRVRAALAVGALAVGLVLAVVTIRSAHPWATSFGSRGGGH